VRTDFVESPTPRNPLGAKGIGEAGAIGVPAAVANAVSDALGGHNIDPPFTPEKLWRSLRNFPSGQSIYPLRHQAVDATTTELDRWGKSGGTSTSDQHIGSSGRTHRRSPIAS
jgi:hypothetical protein